MKILITGISGTLARGVAYRLTRRGHQVIGIDRRPWPDVPEGVEMHQADIRRTGQRLPVERKGRELSQVTS